MPSKRRQPACLALQRGEVHVFGAHGDEQLGRAIPLERPERALVDRISRLGGGLVGGIEREDMVRRREELADLAELARRNRRRTAAELVQAVDVRFERGALIPRPEALIQVGIETGNPSLSPGRRPAPPSSAPPRKVEKTPCAHSTATWSPRLAVRIETPSRSVVAEVASWGRPPAAPEKQQSRIRTTSRTEDSATFVSTCEKAIPGVAGVASRVTSATSVPEPAPWPAK